MRRSTFGPTGLAALMLLMSLLPGRIMAQDALFQEDESAGGGGGADVRYLGVGPRLGLSVDPDQFVIGAQGDFAGFHEDLLFMTLAELGLGDDITTLNFELDGLYLFPPVDFPADLMAGVGIALTRYSWDVPAGYPGDSSEAEVGLELIGGLRLSGPAQMDPRLEFKLGVGDLPDFKIMVSVRL